MELLYKATVMVRASRVEIDGPTKYIEWGDKKISINR